MGWPHEHEKKNGGKTSCRKYHVPTQVQKKIQSYFTFGVANGIATLSTLWSCIQEQ